MIAKNEIKTDPDTYKKRTDESVMDGSDDMNPEIQRFNNVLYELNMLKYSRFCVTLNQPEIEFNFFELHFFIYVDRGNSVSLTELKVVNSVTCTQTRARA